MIKLENYIKYKSYIYNILSVSSLILLGIIAISLINPETTTTYAAENSAENAEGDSGVALLANTTTPSATLEISNSGDNTVLANPDSGTVYSTHSITMSSVNISNYTLSISAPAELQSVSGKTTLSGANGTTGNSMTNNTWGYSYDKAGNISDTGSLAYSSFTGSTQNLESGTTPTTASRNLILAAKFGEDAEAGHYTGTVNLLLTATPKTLTTYSVSYNCNSGTGCPSNYSESSYDDSITYTIPSTTPTRSGYNFLGYNTTNSSTADSTYAPGKTITLTSSSSSRTLYAVWEKSFVDFPGTLTTMQGMTSDICKSVSIGASKTLTDTRDNSTYTIGKLADGKCWMTQNLRIINTTITSADSNVVNPYTIPSSSIWSRPGTEAEYKTLDKAYYDNDIIYGAYYSYYTATAGTTVYITNKGNNATYDICPKGWHLPTGGENGEYQALYNKGASTTQTTNNGKKGYWLGTSSNAAGGAFFPTAGYLVSGVPGDFIGAEGRYWTRTAHGTGTAYSLNLQQNIIRPAESDLRYYGDSIRCIAK